MNFEQKKQIANILAIRAEITGKVLSTQALIMMVEDISDLDFNNTLNILNKWGRTEKGFPYPSDIRSKIEPEINSDDNSQDVANSVITAISKFGYTNQERAKDYIGELGWEAVTRMGGWKHLCETMTHENEGMYRAQIREYSKTIIKLAKRGQLDERPALPEPTAVSNVVHATMKNLEFTS
jgi:hypothetical protein